ncbi:hypothetical protein H671_4g12217 [Cricetulus griseus]|nr:hypothetical protein H671_4g12217 [Cricetulus griseus]
MAHTYNSNTQEAEVGGSPRVFGQPGLHSDFQASMCYRINSASKQLQKKNKKRRRRKLSCVWCPWRREDGVMSSGTDRAEVTDGCELSPGTELRSCARTPSALNL